MPQYSENRDYQTATIHGYQPASYLREINATRAPCTTSISLNKPPPSYSPSSVSNLHDQVLYARAQNEMNALGSPNSQNLTIPRVSTLHAEAPSFEPSLNSVSSINTKKYHSSPDISAIVALGRSAYFDEAAKRSILIGPLPNSDTRSILAKQPYEQLFGVVGRPRKKHGKWKITTNISNFFGY